MSPEMYMLAFGLTLAFSIVAVGWIATHYFVPHVHHHPKPR